MSARYAIGIDLGTTHTVVAWAPVDGTLPPDVLRISQLVAPGQVDALPLLPSVLFAPLDGERADDPFGDAPWVLGEHARRRGTDLPGRFIASSKSWLAHAGVDREAPILPWGTSASEKVPALSPVDAATRLLRHVARVWDRAHPGDRLEDQEVVVTVPASFDEVARSLTSRAAERAGLKARLLEEPQAAFCDWMARAGPSAIRELLECTGGHALVLVVDVGGGTTDLSLVRAFAEDRVERVAVGPHLLLGGDNMDLALAYACEHRFAAAGQDAVRLDAARFAQLALACRSAKERLLSEDAPEEVTVTLLGRGAELVGATHRTQLARTEVERIVIDGFFPLVGADSSPQRNRGALVAFGLPYERDVAITRHIAAFVSRHLPAGAFPNAVLFNGGVFRAERLAERVLLTLASWRGGCPMRRLPDCDPELAVARGAVAFALARRGFGTRMGGGSARAYFVGVEGGDGRPRAVCVVPRGADEGTVHRADGRTFALAVGRPVRFELFASDSADSRAGEVVDVEEESFARLPPLVTRVEGATSEVLVALEGELTAVGTLDLAVAVADAQPPSRFELAFELRGAPQAIAPTAAGPTTPSGRLQLAFELVELAFGKARSDATGREAKDLLRELTRALGERQDWTLEIDRALYDVLLAHARGRRRSADHERVFWLLAGYCIRPGFGHPLDGSRATALAQLLDERLAFPAESRVWQQFWIAWRRAAAGLDERTQTAIRDYADLHLAPLGAVAKKPKKPALSLDDALDTCSALERVDPARRVELGTWILERTWTERDPRLWAALGRLGARVPVYASAHHVVSSSVAERWLEHLLREKWDSNPAAPGAALALSRRTGDRARDVSDRMRHEVEVRLVAAGVDAERLRAVREIVPVDVAEREAFFGDSLPLGLRLVE